ncbi:hypothetical protein HPB51_006939 [Rhipicephalus microplus]|uniref:Uncharacterized protein n=1 Tax=Rhipicephalus microplus TaxID=6941 RepID=A0A9J6DT57_RHIMP|nr:hypothetical protein HPB51_006939 [Rhipicephalus microplus]
MPASRNDFQVERCAYLVSWFFFLSTPPPPPFPLTRFTESRLQLSCSNHLSFFSTTLPALSCYKKNRRKRKRKDRPRPSMPGAWNAARYVQTRNNKLAQADGKQLRSRTILPTGDKEDSCLQPAKQLLAQQLDTFRPVDEVRRAHKPEGELFCSDKDLRPNTFRIHKVTSRVSYLNSRGKRS